MNRRRFLSALGLLFLTAQTAAAALAVDSRMPSAVGDGATGVTSRSFSFTNTAGTLLVCGSVIGNTVVSTITGMTYAGAAMTSAGTAVTWDSGNSVAAVFYKLSPATGANTVAITGTGVGGGSTAMTSGCISYTGNDTTTPIKTYLTNTGSGTSASVAMTSTTSGNKIWDVAGAGSSMTADTQTLSWVNNLSSASAGGNGRSSEANGSGGTVTMAHTISATDSFGVVGVEIAAAGGGPTCTPSLSLLGVGRCG